MSFPNTHWTELAKATLHGQTDARAAMDGFCQRYREPVRNFIRLRRRTDADVEDLTHEFLLHIMEHSLLRRADRERGKFRSFLLGALTRFLRDRAEHGAAQKRGGGMAHLSLDELTDETGRAPGNDASEAVLFDREWALGILERALERVRAEFDGADERRSFEVLRSFLPTRHQGLAYEDAAARLGITLAALKSEVHRLRKRFRALVREEVALTVSAPHEIEEEMQHLQRVLLDRGSDWNGRAKLSRAES
jgi:DNA-directed RNA polymerase specialized sigma24 family protein